MQVALDFDLAGACTRFVLLTQPACWGGSCLV